MSDDKKKDPLTNDPLMNHEYDGIHELDNPLPQWWLMTFYGAIVFSIFYVGYYHIGSGKLIDQEYRQLVSELETKRAAAKMQSKDMLAGITIADLKSDAAKVSAGKAVFKTNCVSCHGENLQGMIGPNLTDEYWIHGNSVAEVWKVIDKGIVEKGMPPWGAILKSDDIINAMAYMYANVGTNPPNAKPPQGDKVSE